LELASSEATDPFNMSDDLVPEGVHEDIHDQSDETRSDDEESMMSSGL
jgi:hypothetical protein